MAIETTVFKVSLDDSGSIKAKTNEMKAFNAEGSKAAKMAAAKADSTAYGQARGSMGATGASGRDFANQAQGLGGLVRLYATWAANIFAVSAAFSALSSAANVSNMIQGMNQLGISSGIALGSMAQRFVEATGGAISLQDAVSATVKAVSSGLSQAQFEKLGQVANQASKALGINMTDAVSRLTRGITKLEPELLDELGIFVKVGTASEDYAKRIGKSVSSLSDFEKRQAFANAVLAEGAQKFGNIKLDANPYDQLAASLTNLSNKVLGLVNVALGPLISLLSSSPTALLLVVGTLGTMLLKQAIPAIGQYKNALAASADESEKKWQQKSDAIKKIEKEQFQYILNMSEAEAETKLASLEKAEQRLKKSKGITGIFDERSQNILQGTTLSKEDRGYLQAKQAEAAAAGNKQLAAAYKEARVALDSWIKSEKLHEKLLQQIAVQTNSNIASASKMSAAGFARDELARAKAAKSRSSLISEAAEGASIGTMSMTWKTLKEGIKTEGLTGASAAMTKLGGAAAIATTIFSRAISVLAGFFGWVGLVVGVLSTLYSFVSSNSKQAEELSSAVDQASEAAKIATGTFAKFNTTLSSESLVAKANATVGLVDSMDKLIEKFLEFDKVSNRIDNAWESLKRLVGLSKQDDVAKGLSTNITKILENLDDPGLKKDFETKLKTLLSVDRLNFDTLDDALESLDPKKLKEISKYTEEIKVKNQATAASIAQLRDGFNSVTTAFTALENTLKPSDPISNFATAVANQSVLMTEAFKNSEVAAATFKDVLKDTSKLNAFPPEAAGQILAASNSYNTLTKSIEESKQRVAEINEQLAKGVRSSLREELKGKLSAFELKIKADEKSIVDLSSVLRKAASTSFKYGLEIALQGFKSAIAQAGIDQQKGLVAMLPKSEATIKAQMTLENQSIDIRKQEIQAIYSLTQEMKLTRASSKVDSLNKKLAALTPQEEAQREPLKAELSLAEAEQKIYTGKMNLKDLPPELRKEYFENLQISKGVQAQLSVLNISKISNEQQTAVKLRLEQFDKANKLDADFIKDQENLRNKDLANTTLTIEARRKIEDDYLEATKLQRQRQATITERQALESIQGVIDVVPKPVQGNLRNAAAQAAQAGGEALAAATADLPNAVKLVEAAEARFRSSEDTTKTLADSALLVATVTREYERGNVINANILEQTTQDYDIKKQSLDTDQKRLDTELSLTNISQQQYDNQTRINRLKEIELDTAQSLNLATADYVKKVREGAQEIALGTATPERVLQIEADREDAIKFYTNARQKVFDLRDSQIKQADTVSDLSKRQIAYTDLFNQGFKSMEDAIVEFTKTGKISFKGMIDSFIEGLLRFEIQKAQTSIFNSMGGIGGLVSSLAGFMDPAGAAAASAALSAQAGAPQMAKGGAWDAGVQAFAKGGMFTNSIVDSPTLFKFAKGTGLMGEAGPEAIMPLKRDANGNLGVRSNEGSANVDVVINNYSTAPATAKETTDSRGNRRIEVTVGDMIAQEVGRTGSNLQQAMTSTYGNRPALARR